MDPTTKQVAELLKRCFAEAAAQRAREAKELQALAKKSTEPKVAR
jgi:Zn-dependent oligopeptidase